MPVSTLLGRWGRAGMGWSLWTAWVDLGHGADVSNVGAKTPSQQEGRQPGKRRNRPRRWLRGQGPAPPTAGFQCGTLRSLKSLRANLAFRFLIEVVCQADRSQFLSLIA